MRFRSFRSRLVVVFLGLFVVIQATGYVVVGAYVRASARHTVEEELRLASTLFARQLEVRSQQLVAATRLLSGDFALKTAVATADYAWTPTSSCWPRSTAASSRTPDGPPGPGRSFRRRGSSPRPKPAVGRRTWWR